MKNINTNFDSLIWQKIKKSIWTETSNLISDLVWHNVNIKTRQHFISRFSFIFKYKINEKFKS